jgi:hypothetical protein
MATFLDLMRAPPEPRLVQPDLPVGDPDAAAIEYRAAISGQEPDSLTRKAAATWTRGLAADQAQAVVDAETLAATTAERKYESDLLEEPNTFSIGRSQ